MRTTELQIIKTQAVVKDNQASHSTVDVESNNAVETSVNNNLDLIQQFQSNLNQVKYLQSKMSYMLGEVKYLVQKV